MKKVRVYVVALGLVALGVAAWIWGKPEMPAATLSPVASVVPGDSAPAARVGDQGPDDRVQEPAPTETKVVGRPLDEARTFASLAANLASSSVSAGQRLEYLRQAAILCENVEQASAHREAMSQSDSQPMSESAMYARDYYKSFCSDFSGSSDEFSSMGLDEGGAGDMGEALQLWEVGPTGEALPLAEDLVLSTEDPSALLAATAYVGPRGLEEWEVQQPTVAERGMSPVARTEARALAARLLACEYSGGCGPNGHLSVIECENVGLCRPGISAADVWRERHSPAVYSYAERLRDRLRELREQHGG